MAFVTNRGRLYLKGFAELDSSRQQEVWTISVTWFKAVMEKIAKMSLTWGETKREMQQWGELAVL